MKPLGIIQFCRPHLPATLGSDLLALGILKSVIIITWGHGKEFPKCLQGVECVGSQTPKGSALSLQCKEVQKALHSTAICSTASQIFLPHSTTEAAIKTKKQTPKLAHLP